MWRLLEQAPESQSANETVILNDGKRSECN